MRSKPKALAAFLSMSDVCPDVCPMLCVLLAVALDWVNCVCMCIATVDTVMFPHAGPVSAKWTVQEDKGGLLHPQHCLPGGLSGILHV